jgi:hypothetical protein
MAEGEAPGTLWSIEKAIDHVHRIEGYELEQELYRLVLRDETLQIAARRGEPFTPFAPSEGSHPLIGHRCQGRSGPGHLAPWGPPMI